MAAGILTVGQVAHRFSKSGEKWTRKRTLRALKAVDAQIHGGLLINTGTRRKPRWVVPTAQLERAFPHLLGLGPAETSSVVVQRSLERQATGIADALEDVEELRQLVDLLVAQNREMTREIDALKTGRAA